jgi:broad specificity phosphatase PhoE
MSIRITYFVHGTTTDNEQHLSSGWNDVELSELGKRQSEELREKNKDLKFDAIFTSDLKRAIDSANITWGDTNMPIFQDERLRECNYGDYNGKPSEEVEPLQEKSILTPMPNGESYEQVKERVSDFLNDLLKKYDGSQVAIVAHKAPQLALDVLLKGRTWSNAFNLDWRKKGEWKPGWDYILGNDNK